MIQRIWCQLNGHEDVVFLSGAFCRHCGQETPAFMQPEWPPVILSVFEQTRAALDRFGAAMLDTAAVIGRAWAEAMESKLGIETVTGVSRRDGDEDRARPSSGRRFWPARFHDQEGGSMTKPTLDEALADLRAQLEALFRPAAERLAHLPPWAVALLVVGMAAFFAAPFVWEFGR